MNGTVNYSVEGAKYGISSGTALAIAISYTNNHSVLWAYHPTAFPMKKRGVRMLRLSWL
jgi:hypothetical protein